MEHRLPQVRGHVSWFIAIVTVVWLAGLFSVQIVLAAQHIGEANGIRILIAAAMWPVLVVWTATGRVVPRSPTRLALTGLIMFSTFALLSCAVSPIPLISLGYVASALAALVIAASFASATSNATNLVILRGFSLLVGLMIAAFAIYDYRPGVRLGNGTWLLNPNTIGAIAMTVGFASLAWRRPLFFVPMVGAVIVIIYLTASRSSATGLIVGGSVFLWLQVLTGPNKRLLRRRVFWLIALAIPLALTWTMISEYFSQFYMLDDVGRGLKSGGTGRVFLWRQTLELIADNPIFGVGYRAHQQFLPASSAHNGYLAMAADIGLLGFTGAFLFFLAGFRGLRKMLKTDSDPLVTAIFLSLLVGYLVVAIFESFLINIGNPLSLLILFILFFSDFEHRAVKRPRERVVWR